jgi:hypothetical protein
VGPPPLVVDPSEGRYRVSSAARILVIADRDFLLPAALNDNGLALLAEDASAGLNEDANRRRPVSYLPAESTPESFPFDVRRG